VYHTDMEPEIAWCNARPVTHWLYLYIGYLF